MNLKPGNYAIRKGAGCGKIVSDWEMRDELMEAGAGKKGVPVDGRDVGVGEGEVEVVRKGVEKLSLVVSGDGVEKDDENRGMEKKVVGLAELIETSKGKNRAPRREYGNSLLLFCGRLKEARTACHRYLILKCLFHPSSFIHTEPIAQSLGFSLILSPGHNVLALADEDDSSSPCSFPLKNSLISPQSSSTNSPSGLATTLAGVGGGIGSYAAAAAGTSTTVTNNKKTENQVEYTSTTSLKKDHTVKDKDQKHLLSTATLTPTMPGSFFSKSVISAMASTPDLSTSFGTPGTDTEEGNLMRPVEMDRDQEEQGVAAEEEEEDGWETVNKSSLLMIEKNNVNKNTKMNGTTKTTKKGDGWIGIEDDRNEEIMFFEVDMEEFDVSG